MRNRPPPAYLRLGTRRVRIPRRRGVRIALGLWLTIGGALPIPPGYVFVPVGLAILSIDFPKLRRWRRRGVVWIGRRRQRKRVSRNPYHQAKPSDCSGHAPAGVEVKRMTRSPGRLLELD
jgi:UPF0716 family protein affecting phage T7 exclusion